MYQPTETIHTFPHKTSSESHQTSEAVLPLPRLESASSVPAVVSQSSRSVDPDGEALDQVRTALEHVHNLPNRELQHCLDSAVTALEEITLGQVEVRSNIRSTAGPFLILPEYKRQYPQVVAEALANLCTEYNRTFDTIVAANREWETDYQYCMSRPNGVPINSLVQIDMVGLPDEFLYTAPQFSVAEVRDVLRGKIFEIENSLAMYSLLEGVFTQREQDSFFKQQFRAALDRLRQMHGKPIALLAATDEKYAAMKALEFGKQSTEPITDEEVQVLSGFDRFFSPEEFKLHLAQNSGACRYLLYARTSDPVAKLRKPSVQVEHPLLANDELRRIIKANAITLNIDAPNTDPIRRINDTKAYLSPMGMAFAVQPETDLRGLFSPEFFTYLAQGGAYAAYTDAPIISVEFAAYLRTQGLDPAAIESGKLSLRAKPMRGAYGCYGHFRGVLGDQGFRKELRKGIRGRGAYVLQPELQTPTVVNRSDGQAFTYIDRNFLSLDKEGYRFMGGFRSLMPLESTEASEGRIHGNVSIVYAQIT